MVSKISSRFQKTIAWCLFFIFYFQMVASAFSSSESNTRYYFNNYAAAGNRNVKTEYNLFKKQSKLSADIEKSIDLDKSDIRLIPAKDSKTLELPTFLGENKQLIENSKSGPGPGQPEMQSFKSVGADNMVDMFSGDFSYNLPLLDVGGYPVGIHYNGGVTMDQEATWVGLGWNINPGVINRSVRGLPDDFNGTDSITKIQNVKPNRTIGGDFSKKIELFAKRIDKTTKKVDTVPSKFGLSVKAGIFYNNYRGWGLEYGITPSMSTGIFSKGNLTAGLSISNNSQTGLDVSPSFGVGISSKGENCSWT